VFRFALRQLRLSARHSLAAAVAVTVATAFIVAAVAGTAVMRRTVANIVAQQYGSADLVVSLTAWSTPISPPLTAPDDALGVEGVSDAFLPITVSGQVRNTAGRAEWTTARSISDNPSLSGWPATQGAEPTAAGQASIAWSLAQRLDVALGDTIIFTTEIWPEELADPGPEPMPLTVGADLRVTGLFDDRLPTFWDRPTIQVAPATLADLGLLDQADGAGIGGFLLVSAEAGADTATDAALAGRLEAELAAAWEAEAESLGCPDGIVPWPGRSELAEAAGGCVLEVRDAADAAAHASRDALDRTLAVTAAGLVAAAVSLLVACLVIGNTLQVVVAGRRRTLALLRAVGATRRQIWSSVLFEAALLAAAASVVGVGLGWALISAAMALAARTHPAIPLPDGVELSPWLAALAVAVGVVAATAAAVLPARSAGRVAPLEALRPLDAPTLASPPGRRRMLWSIGLTALGGAGSVLGLALARGWIVLTVPGGAMFGPLVGIAGAAVMAVGLLVGVVFWLPQMIAAAARSAGRAGGAGRLAAANLVRDPRRTAATATALMIGATLVSGMIVTAACLSDSLDRRIGTTTSVDMVVGNPIGGSFEEGELAGYRKATERSGLPAGLAERLSSTAGVEATATLGEALVAIPDDAGHPHYYSVAVVDRQALAETMNLPDVAEALEPGVIAAPAHFDAYIRAPDGAADPDQMAGVNGTSRRVWVDPNRPAEVRFTSLETLDWMPVGLVADVSTMDQLAAQVVPTQLWLKVSPDGDAVAVQDAVLDAAGDAVLGSAGETAPLPVDSSAVQRAQNRKTVDTMLLIGLAMLAVSVVVALVGVSNTLTLSVMERGREIALLRALGLTQGQTRRLLAAEGAATAGVAGMVAVVVGTGFALLAAGLTLGPIDSFTVTLPWGRLALVLAVSVATGLLASLLPASRAARIPPSQALASL
jgi:putative ABC transport system permease protein